MDRPFPADKVDEPLTVRGANDTGQALGFFAKIGPLARVLSELNGQEKTKPLMPSERHCNRT